MIRRRVVAVGMLAVLGLALLAVPVGAQSSASSHRAADTPESYAASASGDAFKLNLLGTKLAFGSAQTSLSSKPDAHAQGSGALLASQAFGGTQADANANGQNKDSGSPDNPTCQLALPDAVPLLALDASCSYSHAAVADDLPMATAHGASVENLSLGTSSLLQQLGLTDGVNNLIDNVTGVVDSVLSKLPISLPSGTTDQLGSLLKLLTTGPGAALLTGKVGTNTSTVTATDDSVTADSVSNGATLCVLQPVPNLCLVTVTIGKAEAKAVRDRAKNTATPTVDPAVITIKLADQLVDALNSVLAQLAPQLQNLITGLAPGNTITLQQGQSFEFAPLGLKFVASSGSTTKTADGASASAASLEIDLLSNVQQANGGISLALSDANAAVSGKAPVKTSATQQPEAPAAPAAPPQRLAYTGDSPWRPVIGAFLLVAAVIGFEILRRSRRRHAGS